MKNWQKPNKLQVYSFIASMPAIDVLLNYIIYNDRIFHEPIIWLSSFPLIFFIGTISWRSHVAVGNWIKHRYPSIKQTKKRILILCLCILPVMSVSVCIIFFIYDYWSILGYRLAYTDLRQGLIVGFCVNLIFETLFETYFVIEKYQESVEEKMQLEQLSVRSEFDILKNQVNPHFLFNCFNTLSSLISIDKNRAEQFLDELSKVYRYLLRNNEDGLSTVENEIKFIGSFYKLLQTRHGEAVQLHLAIDKKYNQYLVPSLSLQLLVENAVKHNALTKPAPLVIDIFTTEGNKLVVNNNLQRRSVKALSNKVGLKNIEAKYELLKQAGFQVMEDGKNFTVVLPLIWNNADEAKNIFTKN